MKRFVLFIAIGTILLFGLREFLYAGIRKNKIGQYKKLNTLFIEKNDFENIILGSSRAESHIVPEVLKQHTGLSFYNMGMEGEYMPIILGVLKAYLENNKAPKRLILNIDIHPYTGELIVFRFPRFFSYYGNTSLYDALVLSDKRSPYFKWIPYYSMPYFNYKYLVSSMRGYLNKPSAFDLTYTSGFVPIPEENYKRVNREDFTPYRSEPEERIFTSLDSIIAICKSNETELSFVFTPMYHIGYNAIQNGKELREEFITIAEDNEIPYLDYTVSNFSSDSSLFADQFHLKAEGAVKFSHTFARDYQQLLQR